MALGQKTTIRVREDQDNALARPHRKKEGPAPGKGRPSELVGEQERLLSMPRQCPKALPETPGVSRAGMVCSFPQIASDHRKKSLVDHGGGGAGGTKRSIPFLASHRTRKKYPLERPGGAKLQKFANTCRLTLSRGTRGGSATSAAPTPAAAFAPSRELALLLQLLGAGLQGSIVAPLPAFEDIPALAARFDT